MANGLVLSFSVSYDRIRGGRPLVEAWIEKYEEALENPYYEYREVLPENDGLHVCFNWDGHDQGDLIHAVSVLARYMPEGLVVEREIEGTPYPEFYGSRSGRKKAIKRNAIESAHDELLKGGYSLGEDTLKQLLEPFYHP